MDEDPPALHGLLVQGVGDGLVDLAGLVEGWAHVAEDGLHGSGDDVGGFVGGADLVCL